MGRFLIWVGAAILLTGIFWQFGEKLGLGRLPGDLAFKGQGYEIRLPILTCLILSVALSGLMWVWRSFRGP